jgi:hypothetical protein
MVSPTSLTLPFVDTFSLRDAWAKHKDLDSYEAKWLYVDAVLKVSLPRTDVLLLFRFGLNYS